MRITLFNVKYSPNLGDGLLSECLEHELRARADDVAVHSIDLATRVRYGEGGRHRRLLITLLEYAPTVLRRRLAGLALRRMVAPRLRAISRAGLAETDAVVIGGGNLLADADLNFPIKISVALHAAAAAALPVAVFGVGVSDNWSARGRALFGNGLRAVRLVHAAVRDERSQMIWARYLADYDVSPALLCRDPGLLTARHFPADERTGAERIVGLCLTDPMALRYHGGQIDRRLDGWLVSLAEGLARRGLTIRLFTNGSPEDRAYLDRVAPRFAEACGAAVGVEPAFAIPADLAAFVAGCALVVAHRMHACIAAYSYGIPHIGLRWDPKLDSFFASVERSGFIVDPAVSPAGATMDLAVQAIADGVDPVVRAAAIADATDAVERLYRSLMQATAA